MNKEFIWDDEKVLEFVRFTLTQSPTFQGRHTDLEQFKESKQSKPEWEIYSYRHKITQEIAPCGTIGFAKAMYNGDHEIYSVKRLSDDLVVKIGDMIGHRLGDACLKVDLFEIQDNQIYAINNTEEPRKSFACRNWKKIKIVLFTTQDGIEILNGHLHVCSVGRNTFEISECRANLIQKGHHDHYLYFSCRENAEEYILMNKPLLSLADLVKMGYTRTTQLINKAKEKLNKP